jgi:catechol 2,3-dioxygenase-like lactoylglutathione lyase family enzyme
LINSEVTKMKVKSIAHICILSKDLEATRHFYCDLLGFEKIFDFIKEGRVSGFYFKINDDNFIEVFEDKETENTHSKILHICFATENIRKLKKMFNSKNIETTDIILGSDNSYQFWVKDPDGIDIEFHEYTDKSSQITKKNAEMNW